MRLGMWAYIGAWGTACVVAIGVLIGARSRLSLCSVAYWRFLGAPWKIATFAVAAAGITAIAPYTSDPTWDYIDAALMSLLAFSTAPWVVATLYGAMRRRATAEQVFVAICVWLFSASWCYDLYLLIRDGYYPPTWWANLIASSVLYGAAGLFWSLEWTESRGCFFAFTETSWPSTGSAAAPFGRVMWPALCLMLVVGLIVLAFGTPWRWR